MNKSVVIAGLLGAIAMFVWSFVAHMFLPLGEAGIRQIPNEQALLSTMQATIPAHGLYMFPNMPPDNDQAAYMQKIASGPSGLMVYFPQRQFNFGQSLAVEFVTDCVQALIAVYLLSLTALRSFGARLGFFGALGIVVAVATNVGYWNWYGFPATYTAAQIVTTVVEYLCAGLPAAFLGAKLPTRAAASA